MAELPTTPYVAGLAPYERQPLPCALATVERVERIVARTETLDVAKTAAGVLASMVKDREGLIAVLTANLEASRKLIAAMRRTQELMAELHRAEKASPRP